jgi:hypothetical protein
MNPLNGIEIGIDSGTTESAEFVEWLNARGANAYEHGGGGSIVNGHHGGVRGLEIVGHLWETYCNCTEPTSERVAELLAEMK